MSTPAVEWVEIDGRRLRFSNPRKVLWPSTGCTKGDLLDYHLALAPLLLAHVRNRPLTLGRWPDGVHEVGWLQTTCPHPPAWIATHAVSSPRGTGAGRNYCLVEDTAGLVWLTNLGTIELHPLLSTAPTLDRPTTAVVDLDPGPGTTPADVARVALRARAILDTLGVAAWPKTSGARGMHVVIPVSDQTYVDTKTFVRAVARRMAAEDPAAVTDRMAKRERHGRVFVDWGQNDPSKSTVAAYSLRAMPWPSPSTPVTWPEVEAAAAGRSLLRFDAAALRRRVAEHGDLHAPVLTSPQRLPESAAP